MAVHALGGLTWFLADSQLDFELLSMRQFEEYLPNDRVAEVHESKASSFLTEKHHMVRIKTCNHEGIL